MIVRLGGRLRVALSLSPATKSIGPTIEMHSSFFFPFFSTNATSDDGISFFCFFSWPRRFGCGGGGGRAGFPFFLFLGCGMDCGKEAEVEGWWKDTCFTSLICVPAPWIYVWGARALVDIL